MVSQQNGQHVDSFENNKDLGFQADPLDPHNVNEERVKTKEEEEEEKLQVHWLKGEPDHDYVDYASEGNLAQSIFLNLTLKEFLLGLSNSR